MDANAQLMAEIRDQWGAEISQACQASSVQPAFIAALVAEESGGKADAKRFEPGVLHALWEVLLGRKATYGSIGRDDLLRYSVPGFTAPSEPATGTSTDTRQIMLATFAASLKRVDDLATSWGLTQVMGYHVIEKNSGLSNTEDLTVPSRELPYSLRLLAQFALRFDLDLARDTAELFDCWNTGEPGGATADPNYISRGLARMALYAQLPPAAES